MKRILLTLIFLFSFSVFYAQFWIAPNMYAVYFKDKQGTPYSIDKPYKFLSAKAISRRMRLNIPITEQDLPVSPVYVKQIRDLGVKIVEKSKWLNCVVVNVSDTDTAVLRKISQLPFVSHKRYTQGKKDTVDTIIPLEPIEVDKYPNQNYNYYDYGGSARQVKMLNVHLLHNLGYRGQGITIAILDAGFHYVDRLPAFEKLWQNKRILGWYDFVDQDTTVFNKGNHGMMVLSTIGGFLPGKMIGTAPEASFYLFATENENSEYQKEEYNFVCAAEMADSLGVDMIHASLGYTQFDDTINDYTYQNMNGNYAVSTIGADIAASKGIIVVVSAGNSGDEDWHYISAPSDADSVLCVGAVGWMKKVAYFSSRGPSYDGRLKPDVCALGVYAIVEGIDGEVDRASGTSFSGPIVAGAVASLYSAFPKAKPMDIINAVKRSGDRCDKPNFDYGYGIPDFYKAYYLMKTK